MPKPSFAGRSANQVALETDVAVAIIGIFSAFADEDGLNEEEVYALSEMLSSCSQFEEYSEEDLESLVNSALEVFEQEGVAGAMELAIASLDSKEYKEAALITAICVVAIDGEVPSNEQDYLNDLQKALKISDKRASEIVDEIFAEEEEYEEEEE
jgi:tellurite resistance protein